MFDGSDRSDGGSGATWWGQGPERRRGTGGRDHKAVLVSDRAGALALNLVAESEVRKRLFGNVRRLDLHERETR